MTFNTDGMTFKEIVLTAGALIIMAIGVIGIVLPILPGLPIVWLGALFYAHFTHYEVINQSYLINFGIATGALLVLEYVFKLYGAKKMGASKWGMLGAILGMIAGIILHNLPAIILGPFVGATLFEMMLGKGFKDSLKAGCGTFIGFMISTVLQLALALVMVGVFLSKVLAH